MLRGNVVCTLLLASAGNAADCYFRNGNIAVAGPQAYVQCPGLNSCCLPTDTCVSNGLCQDINNHANGSLTSEGNGQYVNYTGLYQTPACINANFSGCDTECTGAKTSGREYVWACNDQLTNYCCADNLTQFECCSGSSNFVLASPTVVSGSTSPSSVTASITSNSAAASSASSTLLSSTFSSSTLSSSTLSSTGAAMTSSEHSSGSLSTGADVGIGVGFAVLVLTIVAGAIWYFHRVRSRQQRNGQPHVQEHRAETAEQYIARPDRKSGGLYNGNLAEVDGGHTVAEIDGHGRPAELEGRYP